MRNENSILLSRGYRGGQRPRRTLKGGQGGTIVGSPCFFRFLSSEKGRNKKTNFVLVQTHLETSTLPSTFKYRLSHKSLPRNAPSAPHLFQPTRHCHPTRNALPAYHLLQPISISNNLMRNALPIPAPSQPRQILLRLTRSVSSAQYLPILLFLYRLPRNELPAQHLPISLFLYRLPRNESPPSSSKYRLTHKSWTRNAPSAKHLLHPIPAPPPDEKLKPLPAPSQSRLPTTA